MRVGGDTNDVSCFAKCAYIRSIYQHAPEDVNSRVQMLSSWVATTKCTGRGWRKKKKMKRWIDEEGVGVGWRLVVGGKWGKWQWYLNLLSMLCDVRVVNTTLMCDISKPPVETVFISGSWQRLQEHLWGSYCEATTIPLLSMVYIFIFLCIFCWFKSAIWKERWGKILFSLKSLFNVLLYFDI